MVLIKTIHLNTEILKAHGINLLVLKSDHLLDVDGISIQTKQDSYLFSRVDIISEYSSNHVDAI